MDAMAGQDSNTSNGLVRRRGSRRRFITRDHGIAQTVEHFGGTEVTGDQPHKTSTVSEDPSSVKQNAYVNDWATNISSGDVISNAFEVPASSRLTAGSSSRAGHAASCVGERCFKPIHRGSTASESSLAGVFSSTGGETTPSGRRCDGQWPTELRTVEEAPAVTQATTAVDSAGNVSGAWWRRRRPPAQPATAADNVYVVAALNTSGSAAADIGLRESGVATLVLPSTMPRSAGSSPGVTKPAGASPLVPSCGSAFSATGRGFGPTSPYSDSAATEMQQRRVTTVKQMAQLFEEASTSRRDQHPQLGVDALAQSRQYAADRANFVVNSELFFFPTSTSTATTETSKLATGELDATIDRLRPTTQFHRTSADVRIAASRQESTADSSSLFPELLSVTNRTCQAGTTNSEQRGVKWRQKSDMHISLQNSAALEPSRSSRDTFRSVESAGRSMARTGGLQMKDKPADCSSEDLQTAMSALENAISMLGSVAGDGSRSAAAAGDELEWTVGVHGDGATLSSGPRWRSRPSRKDPGDTVSDLSNTIRLLDNTVFAIDNAISLPPTASFPTSTHHWKGVGTASAVEFRRSNVVDVTSASRPTVTCQPEILQSRVNAGTAAGTRSCWRRDHTFNSRTEIDVVQRTDSVELVGRQRTSTTSIRKLNAVEPPDPPPRRILPPPAVRREDSFDRPDSPLFHETLPLPTESAIRRHRQRSRGRRTGSASSSESDASGVQRQNRRQRRQQRYQQRRRAASAGTKGRHARRSVQIRDSEGGSQNASDSTDSKDGDQSWRRKSDVTMLPMTSRTATSGPPTNSILTRPPATVEVESAVPPRRGGNDGGVINLGGSGALVHGVVTGSTSVTQQSDHRFAESSSRPKSAPVNASVDSSTSSTVTSGDDTQAVQRPRQLPSFTADCARVSTVIVPFDDTLASIPTCLITQLSPLTVQADDSVRSVAVVVVDVEVRTFDPPGAVPAEERIVVSGRSSSSCSNTSSQSSSSSTSTTSSSSSGSSSTSTTESTDVPQPDPPDNREVPTVAADVTKSSSSSSSTSDSSSSSISDALVPECLDQGHVSTKPEGVMKSSSSSSDDDSCSSGSSDTSSYRSASPPAATLVSVSDVAGTSTLGNSARNPAPAVAVIDAGVTSTNSSKNISAELIDEDVASSTVSSNTTPSTATAVSDPATKSLNGGSSSESNILSSSLASEVAVTSFQGASSENTVTPLAVSDAPVSSTNPGSPANTCPSGDCIPCLGNAADVTSSQGPSVGTDSPPPDTSPAPVSTIRAVVSDPDREHVTLTLHEIKSIVVRDPEVPECVLTAVSRPSTTVSVSALLKTSPTSRSPLLGRTQTTSSSLTTISKVKNATSTSTASSRAVATVVARTRGCTVTSTNRTTPGRTPSSLTAAVTTAVSTFSTSRSFDRPRPSVRPALQSSITGAGANARRPDPPPPRLAWPRRAVNDTMAALESVAAETRDVSQATSVTRSSSSSLASSSSSVRSRSTATTATVPVGSSTTSEMTFTTNCLRASGIIRKQLVQLDSVMHPPPPSSSSTASGPHHTPTTPARARPIRRAQTADLRSLGVHTVASTDTGVIRPRRPTSDDEDVPSARAAVVAAVATKINRSGGDVRLMPSSLTNDLSAPRNRISLPSSSTQQQPQQPRRDQPFVTARIDQFTSRYHSSSQPSARPPPTTAAVAASPGSPWLQRRESAADDDNLDRLVEINARQLVSRSPAVTRSSSAVRRPPTSSVSVTASGVYGRSKATVPVSNSVAKPFSTGRNY